MTKVPLGQGAYDRQYADEPEIQLLNRFFETNPTNLVSRGTLLSRPGSTFFIGAGVGPIRHMTHQPGAFGGDLFFVSGETLYRYDGISAPYAITGIISLLGNPDTTFTAGPGYEHLFIADGLTLRYYDGLSAASGTLTVAAGNIVATDVVLIDTAYYEFTAASVDAGTPLGTLAFPFLIALGTDDEEALLNLKNALDLEEGLAGSDYSTATVINANVTGASSDITKLVVKARVRGVAGNLLVTTETGANISWSGGTLAGGGVHTLNGIDTPDDKGVVSLATLASFAMVVLSNSQRFYWIQPGALIIEPLDFAEAELEPDQINEAWRVGDSVYFMGQTSTEVWYATGNADAPFLRQQGLAFNQGALSGTVARSQTQLTVVAEDLIVYEIAGGPRRISNSGIEEKIRVSRRIEAEGS